MHGKGTLKILEGLVQLLHHSFPLEVIQGKEVSCRTLRILMNAPDLGRR